MASVEEIAGHLVDAGRAQDLHDLLTGASPYCRADAGGTPVGNGAGNEDKSELWKWHRLWTFAIHHLDFVARYGRDHDEVWEGSILRCAYPNEFDEWLRAGAPGLSPHAVAAYLQDHPLEGNGTIRPPGSESLAPNVAPK